MMKSVILTLTVSALHASLASGEPTLDVRAPRDLRALRGGIDVSVLGQDVAAPGPMLEVRIDGTDVTSAVVIGTANPTVTDADADGVFEQYARTYTLDLSAYAWEPTTIELRAVTSTSNGPLVRSRSSGILPAAQFGTSTTFWTSADGDVLTWHLRLREIELDSITLRLLKDSTDVTSLASITQQTVWDETRNGIVHDRLYAFTVDVSGLDWQLGEEIVLEADVGYQKSGAAQSQTATGQSIGKASPEDVQVKKDCATPCVSAFIAAAEVSKAFDGTVSVGGDQGEVASACSNLQNCLANCGFTGSVEVTVGGLTVLVGVNSTVNAAADLVIAVGLDGAQSEAGKSASATNTKSGGAAVAVGGDGGSGQTGGGTAEANSNGGTANAIGGDGGSGSTAGGPGGKATAGNTQLSGTSSAQGGDGGSPAFIDQAGGSGGLANATSGTGDQKSSVENPGGQGGSGIHGTGGTASVIAGQSGGGAGASQPNG